MQLLSQRTKSSRHTSLGKSEMASQKSILYHKQILRTDHTSFPFPIPFYKNIAMF